MGNGVVQRGTGQTGPHSASHTPCRPGYIVTQALGPGVHRWDTLCWVLLSWSGTPTVLAQGPSFQGPSAPSLSGCPRSGLPDPHSQSVSSPRNSSTAMSTPLHGPRSGAAERLAMLFLPGGLLPQTGKARQQKA